MPSCFQGHSNSQRICSLSFFSTRSLLFPNHRWNQQSLFWKCVVFNPGPPGQSWFREIPVFFFFFLFLDEKIWAAMWITRRFLSGKKKKKTKGPVKLWRTLNPEPCPRFIQSHTRECGFKSRGPGQLCPVVKEEGSRRLGTLAKEILEDT